MNTETTILDLALSGDPTVLLDLDNIHPHHFADTRNAAIWRLIEDYKAKNPGQGITRELIFDKLPSITEAHVTPDYLLDIMDLTLISHRGLAGVYANKLIDDTARRHLADACTRGLQIIEAGGDPSDAEASIRELLNQVSTGSTTLVNNDTCLTQITDFTTKATPFTPTPWPDLNQIIGGWKPGGLYVIAARPGVGKTLAALQAATSLADTGHVYFASLEMGGRELWSRIMANIANVPGDAVTRRRHPTPDEQARMTAAAPHLRQLPIHFDDRANLTIGDFVATTRLLHRQHGLTAAFIDYIGLINAAPGDRRARWELIGEYTRTLKNLAKDLQIPIFAIAQLGRQAEQSPGGELQLSHLRESGNIEQDANVVLLLSCPHENGVTDWTRADIHVAKNREGRTGHVLLEREGDYSRLNHLGWTPSRP
mgnify:FL=1|jgi:replicative DNA helicase